MKILFHQNSQRKNAPSNIIPDVLTFHYKENNDNELFCCKKLKQL